ncbi:MAG: 50S ribosomal protein L7Ae [Candidatus Altiarchaeota archaeon]
MTYVKFEIPKELSAKIVEALETSRETGKIKKGTNEVTKAVERGIAKLVVIGTDVQPPEIVMHLPMLCEEKKIPYVYLTKAEIGNAVGINIPTASACIVEEGKAKDVIAEIVKKVNEIKS